MNIYTDELEQVVFESIRKAHNNIIIVSPFIGLNPVKQLVEVVKELKVSCTVITKFERRSFVNGGSSLEALKLLVENNIEVFALQDLHSKVYLIDSINCVVGSANFTYGGLRNNYEILLSLDEASKVEEVNYYVNNLISLIKKSGDWRITFDLVNNEINAINELNSSKVEQESEEFKWGAIINTDQEFKGNEIVLSVSAGDTVELVDKYGIHAHPVKKGYNYRDTNVITFRRSHGGVMENVYLIKKKFVLEMKNWNYQLEVLNLSEEHKVKIKNYIIDRYRVFDFDKAAKYKFYILEHEIKLSNKPRPVRNNTGGRYYTISDLINSEGTVESIDIKEKK